VVEASSAEQGFAFFQSNHVNVVLLEFRLRNDGACRGKTLKEIKPHVPIVVLSGDPEAAKSLSYADLLLPKADRARRIA